MAENDKSNDKSEEALIERTVEEALRISERFAAEPIFGPTGRGYLKSKGVSELIKVKEEGED